jgi:hypothetical protein
MGASDLTSLVLFHKLGIGESKHIERFRRIGLLLTSPAPSLGSQRSRLKSPFLSVHDPSRACPRKVALAAGKIYAALGGDAKEETHWLVKRSRHAKPERSQLVDVTHIVQMNG